MRNGRVPVGDPAFFYGRLVFWGQYSLHFQILFDGLHKGMRLAESTEHGLLLAVDVVEELKALILALLALAELLEGSTGACDEE